MLSARTLTLLITLSLIFAIAFPAVDAHFDSPSARRHAPVAHRMLKKRATSAGPENDNPAGAVSPNQPVGNAAENPTNSDTNTAAAKATNNSPASSASQTDAGASKASATAQTTTVTPAAQTTTTQSSSNGGLLNSILNPLTSTSSTSSSTSTSTSASSTSATSTSTSSSASTTQSSSSAPSSSSTPSATAAPVATQDNNDSVAASRTTSTVTSSPSPSSTQAAGNSSSGVTKIQRNTIIILVAIGASLGLAGLIWTIIRKWKFRPSSSFEDRMQPIDWQPTTDNDRDITEKLGRSNTTGSHGSFTSGNNHGNDHLTVDLPPHDFTPGPAHLAPVGGYADLQRGPSPQPTLQRGPSFRSPSPYEYDVPNPHAAHGAYYNTGAYQGGYDHNRGY